MRIARRYLTLSDLLLPVMISRSAHAVRTVAVLLVSALALGACDSTPGVTGADVTEPRQVNAAAAAPGSFIVVFKDEVTDPAELTRSLAAAGGFRPTFTYTAALKGFAAQLPEQALEALKRNPLVAYVEADGVFTASEVITRTTSLWGLDRIDDRALPLNRTYTATNRGEGVEVHIIDTGILYDHTEFGSDRASFLYDAFGGNGSDCHGHGTHVAGTVGGTTVGVAPGVQLFAVRVLDCSGSGSTSGVIAGVDAVTAKKKANPTIPMVANMSLGGGFSSLLNTAVTNAVNAGVVTAVAAGNSNADACGSSPAAAPAVLTVGSTTSSDARSSFSNYGTCVDLFAPGSGITSAWIGSSTATNTISGTSMASPHVAGVAALYLSANPTASSSAANAAIVGAATTGVVTNPGTGSPNLLLFNQFVPYTLTVTTPTNGAITGVGIDCPTDCTETVPSGTSITLTAAPAIGYRLAGWSGACTNTTGTCTVSMSQDRSVGATFELIPPPPPMHAGNITFTRALAKNGSWTISLSVTVHDAAEKPIGGSAVSVRFGTATPVTCTTSTSTRTLGVCSLKSGTISAATSSVPVTITVSRTNFSYDATANHLTGGTPVTNPFSISKP